MSDSAVPDELGTRSATEAPSKAEPTEPRTTLLLGNPERYELLAEHGRGGLGRVSRAHDHGLGRDVAIKELIKPSPLAELRFLREAMITARLEHPGIVPVHEAGRWPDGTPFYAMKLVSGRPLRELIQERSRVEDRLALLHHVIAVADAIAYAHGRGIIHRDLKPANVIVGEFGETVVIDWGLAKDLSRTDNDDARGSPDPADLVSPDLTSTGVILGTPAYMAPEQARGEHVDQRADVFAIGAMLWELCSLQRVPPDDLEQRHRMLDRDGIDRDLAVIIDKAIAPDPARRYPDAGALAADLKAFKAGARIASRSYSLPETLAHWIRHHRALTGGIAAFGVLIVASVIALAVLYRASESNAQTARSRLVQSYVEQGRRLSLEGEYLRALPYLSEAYSAGDRSPAVQFLIARAERHATTALAVHRHKTAGAISWSKDREIAAGFRADGQVISISDVGEGAIWNPITGEVSAGLPGGYCQPCYSSISADGRFAAIASKAGVLIWDGAAPRRLATGPASRLAIDPRGERIAVVQGATLSVWRVASGEPLWTAAIEMPATQLAWSGDAVVLARVDMTAHIASMTGVAQISKDVPVYALVVGPRGTIATLSTTNVDTWDHDGHQLARIDVESQGVSNIAFSPDDQQVVLADNRGTLRFYRQHGRAFDGEITAHRGVVRGIAFSPDGDRLATVGADLTLKIWRRADHRVIVSLPEVRERYTLAPPRFDPSGARIVVGTSHDARVFQATDPDEELSVTAVEPLETAQYIAGGSRLATSSSRTVQLWSTISGAEIDRITLPYDARSVVSPDGTLLVAGVYSKLTTQWADGGPLDIYDLSTHAVRHRIPGKFAWAAFDHTGQRIVTTNSAHDIEIWTTGGERLARLGGHTDRVNIAWFSSDDRRILSESQDRTVRIWDVESSRMITSYSWDRGLRGAALDPSGRWVVISGNQTTWILDASTMIPLRVLQGEGYWAHIQVTPDRSLLAGNTMSGVVTLRDVDTGSVLAELAHTQMVPSIELSPDKARLLSASYDKTAVSWRIDRETRPAEVVAAFVRCHAPYRLVETRLEPAEPVCE